jgi:hypothetical protein
MSLPEAFFRGNLTHAYLDGEFTAEIIKGI